MEYDFDNRSGRDRKCERGLNFMYEEGVYLVTEQMAENPATTKRIEGDKLERQIKEDKKETARIEQEKNRPLKKN